MLAFILVFATVASGATIPRRQAECATTTTLDPLTLTRVEPISIYFLGVLHSVTNFHYEMFTAVYTTVYPTFCPTCPQGLRPETYTITQTCADSIASCKVFESDMPPGFTTTEATCTDCSTPFSAILTVPQTANNVFATYVETVTELGATTTRTVTRTCAGGPCLSSITGVPGSVSTIKDNFFAEPVTRTSTVTEIEPTTATVTSDTDVSFRPASFKSDAGPDVFSKRPLLLGAGAFGLSLLFNL
ncbi:hypothetical protein EsH8_I_000090 [Colletotrichum jinshuiense]